MKLTIASSKLGRAVTFSRPGRAYIFVDLNGQAGTAGRQICRGGSLGGSTLTYSGENPAAFEAICRTWWRGYLRDLNERG